MHQNIIMRITNFEKINLNQFWWISFVDFTVASLKIKICSKISSSLFLLITFKVHILIVFKKTPVGEKLLMCGKVS